MSGSLNGLLRVICRQRGPRLAVTSRQDWSGSRPQGQAGRLTGTNAANCVLRWQQASWALHQDLTPSNWTPVSNPALSAPRGGVALAGTVPANRSQGPSPLSPYSAKTWSQPEGPETAFRGSGLFG